MTSKFFEPAKTRNQGPVFPLHTSKRTGAARTARQLPACLGFPCAAFQAFQHQTQKPLSHLEQVYEATAQRSAESWACDS